MKSIILILTPLTFVHLYTNVKQTKFDENRLIFRGCSTESKFLNIVILLIFFGKSFISFTPFNIFGLNSTPKRKNVSSKNGTNLENIY